MRHRERLNPDELRELEAIELALAGEPVDHDLRELEDLVRDVRATAPEMSPALTARLERIVDEGPLATAAPEDGPKPRRAKRWVLVPALGTAAAVIVALVVVLGKGDTTSAPDVPSALSAAGRGPVTSAPSGSASADEAAAPATGAARRGRLLVAPAKGAARRVAPAPAPSAVRSAGGAGAVAPQRTRKVQRSVFLLLSTGKDAVESTADEVNQTVDRFRGIVASSSVDTNDTSGGEATFDLRIPTSRLDDALAALAKLGHVTQRRQDLQDITSSFTSTQDRLDEARAERSGLLKAIGKATTQNQITSLRAQLRVVRAQIVSAKTQLASLQRRASYSRVDMTVRGNGKAQTGGGGWSPGDAAGDALRVLEVIAGVALIALAVALPLALLGIAILWGSRLARMRRRESALDGA